MKSFSDKTEIRKIKLFDRVTLENESKINKRVGSNKNMYAGKKCQKLKRVYMFIKQTRVGFKKKLVMDRGDPKYM